MSTLFVILLLATLVFLAWGLISPASLSKHSEKPLTRRDAGIGFGVIAIVFAVLAGATAPKTTNIANTAAKTSDSAQAQTKEPEVTTKTVTETKSIAFTSTTVNDSSMNKGTTEVTTAGVNGETTLTYKVTYADGEETNRKLISEKVTKKPVTQVTHVGTYVKPKPTSNCDSNYSGCVPVASDVDCAGGSGNGPAYTGPVQVLGYDIYDLDRDGDGYACE